MKIIRDHMGDFKGVEIDTGGGKDERRIMKQERLNGVKAKRT